MWNRRSRAPANGGQLELVGVCDLDRRIDPHKSPHARALIRRAFPGSNCLILSMASHPHFPLRAMAEAIHEVASRGDLTEADVASADGEVSPSSYS